MDTKKNKNDWLSWVTGMVGGVLLWEFFKPTTPAQAAAAIAKTYPSLGAVSLRIDALSKDFAAGKVSAQAALVEAQQLADAANSFSLTNGEDATVVYAQALALRDSIKQKAGL